MREKERGRKRPKRTLSVVGQTHEGERKRAARHWRVYVCADACAFVGEREKRFRDGDCCVRVNRSENWLRAGTAASVFGYVCAH